MQLLVLMHIVHLSAAVEKIFLESMSYEGDIPSN